MECVMKEHANGKRHPLRLAQSPSVECLVRRFEVVGLLAEELK
jgi:hypothetical protein